MDNPFGVYVGYVIVGTILLTCAEMGYGYYLGAWVDSEHFGSILLNNLGVVAIFPLYFAIAWVSVVSCGQPWGSNEGCAEAPGIIKMYVIVFGGGFTLLLVSGIAYLIYKRGLPNIFAPGPYVHPVHHLMRGKQQQAMDEFIRTMRATAFDDDRAAQLWQRLPYKQQMKWLKRYNERASQAQMLKALAEAQAEAIKADVGLGEAVLEREALKEAIRRAGKTL